MLKSFGRLGFPVSLQCMAPYSQASVKVIEKENKKNLERIFFFEFSCLPPQSHDLRMASMQWRKSLRSRPSNHTQQAKMRNLEVILHAPGEVTSATN